MFQAINGWTKAAILKVIQDQFTVKSINENGTCVYRGENGAKCAVGVFIPDNAYQSEMDKGTDIEIATDIETILEHYPNLGQLMPLELEALQKLQSIHDSIHNNEPSYNGIIKDSRSGTEIKSQLIQWVNANVTDEYL